MSEPSSAGDAAAGAAATTRRRRSLVGGTLWRVAIRISCVVAIASIASYLHVRASLEGQTLEQLKVLASERRERESAVFDLADERLAAFAQAVEARLTAPADGSALADFERLFERRPDGTRRLSAGFFERTGITGIVSRSTIVEEAVARRLIALIEVLEVHGPAWQARLRNLFVVTPENAILMYWPGKPWALQASDWELYGKLAAALGRPGEVVVVGEGGGPAGVTRWSEPYLDYGAREWVVSATRGVDVDGRRVATLGQDLLLEELFQRTAARAADGTYGMIMAADGRLIAHPDYMLAIRAQSRAIDARASGDDRLLRAVGLLATASSGDLVVDRAGGEVLAFSRLAGPGWWLVGAFPEAIIERRAALTARWVLLVGVVALLVELAILWVVLRRQVAAPLTALVDATGAVAAGRFDVPLPVAREDELGGLARSFGVMAGEIEARETALAERGRSLAAANLQLEGELEERRRIQAELERQLELRALLDTIDYGVLITGPDRRVRMHNRAYREMIGMPVALLATSPTLDELARYGLEHGFLAPQPDDGSRYLEELGQLIERGDGEPHEWRLASGRVLRRRIVALPDGGRLLTYVDLTAQKRIEADLRTAKEAAEQASRAKSAFLANVSHEFRTPLNAITGYSELMLEEAADGAGAKLRPDLERVRDAGRHLLALINDILDLSKIEAGRIDVAVRPCRIEPVLEACVTTVGPMVGAGVTLHGTAAAHLPEIAADPDRVGQILVNLLSNAAKFTEAGTIEVRTSAGDGWVRVAVVDTGIGIPEELHETVFEEFRQVAVTGGRRRQGTGLGLAIARRLARLMGGDVTLASCPGTGSTFTLVIPAIDT